MEGQTLAPLSGKHVVEGSARTVCLREKIFSLTGDSFSVQDCDGNPVFKIEGKVFSIHQRKILRCAETNQELGIIKQSNLTLHRRQFILDPHEREVATVAKKSLIQFFSTDTVIDMSDGGHIEVEGDFIGRKFNFIYKGMEIAKVHTDFLNARFLVAHKDTYCLTVAPGVDMAFMVLATVCLDEIWHDQKN
eukprot:TRINITY_DN567_c0_g1_i1.p1 TRINITY_DN567_c0_g1~~TRINITY_DN567_c0_g1_i1.p1  ORF type:complete len:191 (+),score=19.76 TRINITY_DN567_c0_g1_i1:66-638(+)